MDRSPTRHPSCTESFGSVIGIPTPRHRPRLLYCCHGSVGRSRRGDVACAEESPGSLDTLPGNAWARREA